MYIGLCYRLFTALNLYLEILKTCKNALEREIFRNQICLDDNPLHSIYCSYSRDLNLWFIVHYRYYDVKTEAYNQKDVFLQKARSPNPYLALLLPRPKGNNFCFIFYPLYNSLLL